MFRLIHIINNYKIVWLQFVTQMMQNGNVITRQKKTYLRGYIFYLYFVPGPKEKEYFFIPKPKEKEEKEERKKNKIRE